MRNRILNRLNRDWEVTALLHVGQTGTRPASRETCHRHGLGSLRGPAREGEGEGMPVGHLLKERLPAVGPAGASQKESVPKRKNLV